MTGVLASVRSADEAQAALAAGADIIDLKEPRSGALGALPAEVIRTAIARIGGCRPLSATVGDLPMEPQLLARAVRSVGALGVDFVKVGLREDPALASCLTALGAAAACGTRVVVVLFADTAPDFDLIERTRDHGLAGLMLDTADKRNGTLRDFLDDARLSEFIARARAVGLMTGLAGSLRASDIADLVALGPDYLGFRGALCSNGRAAVLDPERTRAICAVVRVQAARSAATATAGAHRAAHSRASAVPSMSVAKST
jgi:uncharacterized protein (UPF0264 family)